MSAFAYPWSLEKHRRDQNDPGCYRPTRRRESQVVMRNRPSRRRPPPASQGAYLAQAEACLAQAAIAPDAVARALHEEECTLYLMLARQRRAIEDVLQAYLGQAEATA